MYQDSITGLPIGESFWDFASKMWAADEKNRFAVLSLHIDSYQKKTYFYKHPQYHAILALFAQKVIRASDYMLSAYRVNNTSFLVLLDSELLPLSQMKSKIEADLRAFTQSLEAVYPDISLRFWGGISIAAKELSDIRESAEYAKTAAIAASNVSPVSQVFILFYQDSLSSRQQENRILPLFEDVLLYHHLVIYLQPIFHLTSAAPSSAEALVRIVNANGQLLSPAAFLPVLEKYGIAYQLDLMVLESIMKLLESWEMQGIKPVPVHINICHEDFLSMDFRQIFYEILEKYEAVQQYIGFEISATDFYSNRDYMEPAIEELRALGCHISMDGFGADGMMFCNFEIPPVDMVKFNRSFLCTGLKNENNHFIVKKITEMFEACNIPVLCGGIEDEDEEAFIRQCGIQYVQGFYYGRPVPLDIFQKKYMLPQPAHAAWNRNPA